MTHDDWTQTQTGNWTHPSARTVEYDVDLWWAYHRDGFRIAQCGDTAHEAATAAGWFDFPADPHDPDVMLGFLTLCAVLRVWATGLELSDRAHQWSHSECPWCAPEPCVCRR